LTWLLDTNACIAVLDPAPSPVQTRLRAVRLGGEVTHVSSIVVHELWWGVERSALRESNTQGLEAFLSNQDTLPFDDDDAFAAAGIRAELARRGTPVGAYDLLIAAQARRRGLTLVTANSREFARIPGLAWEDWAKPVRR
jgi:tRNA(fMet)-specific endonuclease VapC